MVTIAYNNLNRIVEHSSEEVEALTSLKEKWVHMINPSDKEIEWVEDMTSIPGDVLKAALDEDERARIEKDDDYLLILVDIPAVEDDEETGGVIYTTLPLGIIVKDKTIVTVCLKDSSIIRDFQLGRVKDVIINKTARFVFRLLLSIATKYLAYLRQIDKTSQHIQAELHKSMKNKGLNDLLDIQNALIYFSNSLKANNNVIDKLIKSNSYLPKYEEDQDLIEDVGIESLQALDTCNTFRDILESTMAAYSSVISNNLNNVMKVLTSITFIVSVPTLIGSLFGMNLDGIPGYSGTGKFPFAFLIVSLISIVCAVVCAIIMKKKKLL